MLQEGLKRNLSVASEKKTTQGVGIGAVRVVFHFVMLAVAGIWTRLALKEREKFWAYSSAVP